MEKEEKSEDLEKVQIFSNTDEKLKFLGKILNNESSREILLLLIEKEFTANEIAIQMKLSLPLVLYHINQMIQAGIVVICKTSSNGKNQPIKYYSAKSGIVILPEKASQKAKESKSFSNLLKKIMKFASVGIAGITSWFSIRYVQFQQNMQSNDITTGYEYVEDSSFDWFAIDNEIWIPIIITSVIIISLIYFITRKIQIVNFVKKEKRN